MNTRTLLDTAAAVKKLQAGHVIAYPTEAGYGLGCDPRNEAAVRQLLALKHRPESSGLILIGRCFEQFTPWVGEVTADQVETASKTWPGAVTWLFPRGGNVPDVVAGDHQTIAIRVTDHERCIQLCNAFGGPVISTSANPHSAPPARSSVEVEDYFGSYLGGILAGPLGGRTATSEIRDLQTGEVLRG